MVCSDTSAVQSVVRMKLDEDKLVPVDSHKLFALSGEAGDRVNFSEYIIANVRLYALRNAAQLSTKAVANYTRSELATALRKVGAWLGAVGRWGSARACVRAGMGSKEGLGAKKLPPAAS
jgi:20S proteasome subunit beta 4